MKALAAMPGSGQKSGPKHIPTAISENGEGRIVQLPIRLLHDDPTQMRKTYQQEYIDLLADTIGIIGLLHPIAVKEEVPKKKYRIIAGHRRKRACQKAGLKTLPARVFKKIDKETFISIQISENTYQPVPPHEAAEKYHELFTRLKEKYKKFSIRRLSRVIGRSETVLRGAFRFVTLNPTVKEYIKDGALPYGAGILLAEVKDTNIQNELAIQAIVTHARVLVKNIRDLIGGYELSKTQTDMTEIFYESSEAAEKERIRSMKFFVDKLAHTQMLTAIGYWRNILYLHKKNQGTQYDPLRNRSVRGRFKELEVLTEDIRTTLKEREKRKKD